MNRSLLYFNFFEMLRRDCISNKIEMSRRKWYHFSMRPYDELAVAQAAKVLSDPIRLKILTLLKEGRQDSYQSPICSAYAHAICPEDLKLGLGDVSSSKLSYHLKELKDIGFIQECREGKRIYYLLKPDRFKNLIESLHGFC